jgi:hypothetical protein
MAKNGGRPMPRCVQRTLHLACVGPRRHFVRQTVSNAADRGISRMTVWDCVLSVSLGS